jgi:ABC-2 type transport system ATP-binding protein
MTPDTSRPVVLDRLEKVFHARRRRGLFRRSARVEVRALDGISFAIERGEVFGLLGPNGAGKTTLIRCLTTLLVPSGGEAWVNGYRLTEDDDRIRASLGCMLMGDRGLYWKLTGRENLIFFGALYHLGSRQRRRRADELIDRFGLGEIADRAVETYSSGQKMKLAFAKSLVHDAPLIILDEPTNTLDVPSARELRAEVRQQSGEGRTVIYTTHILSEAETLCDRVAIIDRGRVLALGTVPELKASLHLDEVIHVEGVLSSRATAAVEALPGVRRAVSSAVDGLTRLTVVAREQRDGLLSDLISTLTAHRSVIQRIAPEEVTLEDVFISHTGRTLVEDTRAEHGAEPGAER